MNVKLVSIVAGAAMLCGVAQASATIMDVTYIGKVSSGTDPLNIFGMRGVNIIGLSWVATYTFDTSLGKRSTSTTRDNVYGGPYYGSTSTSPVLSSMITINGVGKAVAGSYAGYLNAENNGAGGYGEEYHYAGDASSTQAEVLSSFISNNVGSLPGSLTTPFTHTMDSRDYIKAYYSLNDYNLGPETIFADLATLTVSEHVAAVPEPSTWAMMLLGFAGVGFAVYWKRKTGTVAMAAA
jgi:hypothetical protein